MEDRIVGQDRVFRNNRNCCNCSNVVSLKHCFFSTTKKDELYLNLVLEYFPETVYRVSKHYSRANQRMPMIYVKLYTYQVLGTPTREEINCMNPNYTEFTRLILGTK
ncbi:unnamed protein product [Brassica oleracea]